MPGIKVIAAPGPVSFPLVAAGDENFDIEFSKDGTAGIVLDSSVSLVKRGIKPNVSLIRKLSLISPGIGKNIALWRRGSSNDVLMHAVLDLKNINSSIIYADTQKDVMDLLKRGVADSAVILSASGKGISFEEILESHGIAMPGSCAAYVSPEHRKIFERAYNLGIERIKTDPEETGRYVASVLPVKFDWNFIHASINGSEAGVHDTGGISDFEKLVQKHL